MANIMLTECKLCGSKKLAWGLTHPWLHKCMDCGYIFDNPQPSAEDIEVYYSRPVQYDSWMQELPQREKMWLRRLNKMEHAGFYTGSIFDIGAGTGQFLYMSKNLFGTIGGTEISDSAIAISREKYHIPLIKGSIESLDIGHQQFNNITMFHVLEHVSDPVAVIRKVRSMLSKNQQNRLFIAVPNDIESAKPGWPQKITLDGSMGEIHLSHFTPECLRNLLEREGFRIIEMSLDPYFVTKGVHLYANWLQYITFLVIWGITGKNYYDTIWVAAELKT